MNHCLDRPMICFDIPAIRRGPIPENNQFKYAVTTEYIHIDFKLWCNKIKSLKMR